MSSSLRAFREAAAGMTAMRKREKLEAITCTLFNQLPNTNVRNGMKQLKRPLKGPSTAKYYPDHIEHFEKATLEMKRDLMFTDESEERQLERLDSLIGRGKGPPAKGKGKRATLAEKKKKK